MGDKAKKEYILNDVLKCLEKKYPRGLYDWLYAYDRGTYEEIIRLEDEVNQNFLNDGSISDLKFILREYWRVHIMAIKAFNENGECGSSLDEIRHERIKQLETAHL